MISVELLDKVLSEMGYYIGCIGCDYDKANNIDRMPHTKDQILDDVVRAINEHNT